MRAIARRNRHKWPFDIKRSALLVIDMQRYFLEPRRHGFCPAAVAVIGNVRRLIEHFRKNDRPVIFTRHAHKKNGSDLGILGKWWDGMPTEGSPESELDLRINLPPLKKGGRGGFEYVLTKSRYSAFVGTKLDSILKKHKVKEVVITGVMTNICCETTARDAFMRDYMVRFLADATGSPEERMHVATLYNLAYAFADVCTTEELLFERSRERFLSNR